MIEAVIFDLDDTLYPELSYIRSGFCHVAARVAARCGLNPAAVEALLWEEYHRSREGVLDRLLRRLPPCAGLGAQALVRAYRRHRPALTLEPEVHRTLLALRQRYRLGLVSDGWLFTQRQKLCALGIVPVFDAICLTDRWGRAFWKPHRRGYCTVLRRLRVRPERACYVGDNPAKDFVAPNRLGMRSVRIRRPDGLYRDVLPPPGGEAERCIRAFAELLPVLDRL